MFGWVLEQATDKLSSLFPSSTSSSATGTSSDPALKDLERLHRTMNRIHAVLRDADERKITSHAERLRLSELSEVAYDAEDVVDEYQYEVLRSSCLQQSDALPPTETDQISEIVTSRGPNDLSTSHHIKRKRTSGEKASKLCMNAITVPVPDDLAVRVKKIRESFEEITKDWQDLNLKASTGKKRPNRNKSNRHLAISLVEPNIYGRENETEEIVQKLLHGNANQSSNNISVLVITGLGGVGKTTIAQLAYNDPKVGRCFDLRAWVCVPMNFDVEKLTRGILTSITGKKWGHLGLDNLQQRLIKEVEGKSFLLILDDVWNEREDLWCKFQLPFNHAKFKYGVMLVTTRNNNVARLMGTMPSYPLSILPFDNCWSLFKQIVFGHQDVEKYSNLLDIGEKIVRKCGGLPLAIRALGNALRAVNEDKEPDEEKWEDVLNSELWEITRGINEEGDNEVLPALKLSYDQMPSQLKQCFLIFSLFPKDFIFVKENIVKLWIALGFVQLGGKKLAEDIGASYLDNLVQRSMIQKNCYGQRVDGFSMHNLIHDLAQFMAGKGFSRKEVKELEDLPFDV